MMKHEFEKLIGKDISNEDYKIVEYVYTWHPCISETNGKQQIADLYKIGEMSIIKSMVEVAKKAQIIERKISKLRAEITTLEVERLNLRSGDWDCDLTTEEMRNDLA